MSAKGQLQNVNFPQAKRLKSAGFDWQCNAFFIAQNGNIVKNAMLNNWNESRLQVSAPTIALALNYLRDVKGVQYQVGNFSSYKSQPICSKTYFNRCGYSVFVNGKYDCAGGFDSYEEAESALLDAVLGEIEKGVTK